MEQYQDLLNQCVLRYERWDRSVTDEIRVIIEKLDKPQLKQALRDNFNWAYLILNIPGIEMKLDDSFFEVLADYNTFICVTRRFKNEKDRGFSKEYRDEHILWDLFRYTPRLFDKYNFNKNRKLEYLHGLTKMNDLDEKIVNLLQKKIEEISNWTEYKYWIDLL